MSVSATRTRRPAGWGRALSARKVKHQIRYWQRWQHPDGTVWMVVNVWRHDGRAQLAGYRAQRAVTFSELGRSYRLIEEEH